MKFIVLSRRVIREYTATRKHIVISITDPEREYLKLPDVDSRVELLRLKFHDMDRPIEGYKLFTQEQAKTIWNFFQRYRSQIEAVICQCEAGISRSAAVAAALAKVDGQDDSEFFKRYHPNRLVYRMIIEKVEEQRRYFKWTKEYEQGSKKKEIDHCKACGIAISNSIYSGLCKTCYKDLNE